MQKAKKKFAIVLSGSGHRDGSEITETVATIIALDKEGAEYTFFAPDITVPRLNHMTHNEDGNQNILAESARISRGQSRPLSDLQEKDFDGIVLPGGMGVAKNLSTWSQEAAKCTVLPALSKVLTDFHAASKPIGAICIAPAIVARVLGQHQISLTLGDSLETAKEVEKTGAIHENCNVDDYVSDRLNKVLSTPAYMDHTAKPAQIFLGISKMIREFVEMA